MPKSLWLASFPARSRLPAYHLRGRHLRGRRAGSAPPRWWLRGAGSLVGLALLLSGCGDPETANPPAAEAAATTPSGTASEADRDEPRRPTPPPIDSLPPTPGERSPQVAPSETTVQPIPTPQPSAAANTLPMLPLAEPESVTDTPDPQRRQLRADLTSKELRDFLADADRTMQAIASGTAGIQDQDEAMAEMQRISRLKLEASRRLRNMPDADPEVRRDGARGELQSLSHLAALGDLKAALELEKLAQANLADDDPRLVTDSRLVLIGFAIESLQNGAEDAPQRITRLVSDLANSAASSDIPAMMVMGQARQTLAQYGHDAEAQAIRDTILDLYADASDPEIAKMAAQVAGSVHFDEIDRLLRLAIEGEAVAPSDWKAASEALIRESPDLQTVQYL
ncbi:MAG: hypothetical protein ACF788_08505, partial [Novipirellula sp. JB048]